MDEYMQEWSLCAKEAKADELAKRYHAETETYDRTVCTGPIRDGAVIPITPHEFALVNRNAIKARRRIMDEASCCGISPEEMRRAISRNA